MLQPFKAPKAETEVAEVNTKVAKSVELKPIIIEFKAAMFVSLMFDALT